MPVNTAGHELGSPEAAWDELCMFVALIDDGFSCSDDQTGVVINACIHAELDF